MALPRVNNPTYTLELPSTGEKIKYRPFLVKEQKILMMEPQDTKDETQLADAMGHVSIILHIWNTRCRQHHLCLT